MIARRLSGIYPVTILLAALAIAGLADGSGAPPSRTPRGYLTSLPELARIKALAEQKAEPYAAAVAATVAYADGLLGMNRAYKVPAAYAFDHTRTNFPDWMCDMDAAAYGFALAFRLTGKAVYAERSREYLLALQQCRNMNATYQRQAMLNVSIHIPTFVFAADLLEGWGGWSEADRRQFQDWICRIAYPLSRRGLAQSGGNWHAWAEGANLAFADYCWDRPDLEFRSENPYDPVVLSAAEAWAYGRQEFFNQADGFNGAVTSSGSDNLVLSQADILKKSMIRPDGGVPDELRREQAPESTHITTEFNASHNYMGFHRDGLMVACEIAYRRGDPSLFANTCRTADQHYVAETGALVTLPAGRGSPRELLTFLLANQDRGGKALSLNDGHKGSLEIFLRRYQDRVLPALVDWRIENGQLAGGRYENQVWPQVCVDRLLEQLKKFRPIANSAWVHFTTLTHADPLHKVGEPPTVTAPGWEIKTPSAPRKLAAIPHNGLVSLSWYAPPGATSYNIKRSTRPDAGFTTIAAGWAAGKYTDTGLKNGVTYYYLVTAVNAGREGAASEVVPTMPTGVRGYLTTPRELAEISQKAQSGLEPYKSALASLLTTVDNGKFQPAPVGAVTCKASDSPPYLTAGAPLVYGLALAYQLTGENRYADRVRTAIRGLCGITSFGGGDGPLTLGRHIPGWVRAADLIDDYWAKTEKKAFQDWLAAVVYPSLLTKYRRPNNWGAVITNAGQHIADFCHDRPEMKLGDQTPAAAYQLHRQQALDRMNGLCWEDDNAPEGKAMIRPDGGIPDEIRRTEGASYDDTALKAGTAGHSYTEGHIGALIAQAELCWRRGDSAIYDNIMTAAGKTPNGVVLPAGRGSLKQAILFVIEPPNWIEWDKKQSLMIAARYYRYALMLQLARKGRPHGAAGSDKVNHFTTLTHDFAEGENPGPPPVVAPPRD